ncbi:MAG: hypothetical protein AAFO94_15660 [Bacteroidota bacterium]
MKYRTKTKNKLLQRLFRNTAEQNLMAPYRHTQISTFIPLILLPSVILFIVLAFFNPASFWVLIGSALLMGTFIPLFSSLTVKVATNQIRLHYGVGLIKKTINLDELESVTMVKTSWIHGYGIRIVPGGMLYNIQGPYAVELRFKNKKNFIRIGTDEPEALLKAIENQRLL